MKIEPGNLHGVGCHHSFYIELQQQFDRALTCCDPVNRGCGQPLGSWAKVLCTEMGLTSIPNTMYIPNLVILRPPFY